MTAREQRVHDDALTFGCEIGRDSLGNVVIRTRNRVVPITYVGYGRVEAEKSFRRAYGLEGRHIFRREV